MGHHPKLFLPNAKLPFALGWISGRFHFHCRKTCVKAETSSCPFDEQMRRMWLKHWKIPLLPQLKFWLLGSIGIFKNWTQKSNIGGSIVCVWNMIINEHNSGASKTSVAKPIHKVVMVLWIQRGSVTHPPYPSTITPSRLPSHTSLIIFFISNNDNGMGYRVWILEWSLLWARLEDDSVKEVLFQLWNGLMHSEQNVGWSGSDWMGDTP